MEQELRQRLDELQGKVDSLVNLAASQEQQIADLADRPNIDRNLDPIARKVLEDVVFDSIFDLTWNNIYTYNTDFQSLDGFSTSSTGDNSGVQLFGGGVQIGANDTGGGAALATITRVISSSSRFNFDEESVFRTEVTAGNGDDNFDFSICIGAEGNNSAYGFKIEDAAIKGFTTDASSTNTVDLGSTFSGLVKLEARFFPGERVDFLVDKKTLGSSTDNLPETSTTILWTGDVSTTAYSGNDRNVIVYFVDYFQRKIN